MKLSPEEIRDAIETPWEDQLAKLLTDKDPDMRTRARLAAALNEPIAGWVMDEIHRGTSCGTIISTMLQFFGYEVAVISGSFKLMDLDRVIPMMVEVFSDTIKKCLELKEQIDASRKKE